MSLCNSACPSGTNGCKSFKSVGCPRPESLPSPCPPHFHPSLAPPGPPRSLPGERARTASLPPPGPPRSLLPARLALFLMSLSSSPSCRRPLPLQERPRGMLTYLDRPGMTPPAEPRPLPEPPNPLSFHPLPSPLPPAPARRRHGSRPSTGRLCRAGPGRAGFSALFAI